MRDDARRAARRRASTADWSRSATAARTDVVRRTRVRFSEPGPLLPTAMRPRTVDECSRSRRAVARRAGRTPRAWPGVAGLRLALPPGGDRVLDVTVSTRSPSPGPRGRSQGRRRRADRARRGGGSAPRVAQQLGRRSSTTPCRSPSAPSAGRWPTCAAGRTAARARASATSRPACRGSARLFGRDSIITAPPAARGPAADRAARR